VRRVDFAYAMFQVVDFIDVTSGFPGAVNDNLYYYNTFSSSVTGSTGAFMTNDGGQVSSDALAIPPSFGGTDIIAGMEELKAAFTASGATGGESSLWCNDHIHKYYTKDRRACKQHTSAITQRATCKCGKLSI
jgi:hypothetical protein